MIILLVSCASSADKNDAKVIRYSTKTPEIKKLKSDEVLSDDDLNKKNIKRPRYNITPLHETVFEQAYNLLDKQPDSIVYVNGRKFKLDCIGTVAAIFFGAGIDILEGSGAVAKAGDNGVTILYKLLKQKNAIYRTNYPKVGDVIFWDNTWDRNNDGRFGNDPLTHVGIVTKIDDDGTIHYVHENYVYGVVVEYMNLYRPKDVRDENGKILNSALYMNSSETKKLGHPWLSGDLFREFGGVILSLDNK